VNDAPAERGGDSAWARLRRRKVVQWGLLYVAGAWGFLQGLEYVVESFHWPDQLRQIALLAMLIGLPIVLVVAWYHGDRGERQVTRTELAIITLLFFVGGGIFWLYDRASEHSPTTSETSDAGKASLTTGDARPSIAVLPFDNRSKLEDDAYFVDGIHDDILTQLSKISALRVISRTSVEQFRDKKLSTRAIAEQLGVTKILEGGVQRGGDRVRINVQLIDASTDAHLWAETYDRKLTADDIFAIQSEVAAAIADALEAALTSEEQVRVNAVPTRNLKVWEAYQLGRQRMAVRTSAALAEAEQFFRESIALDPAFPLGYVGLADVLQIQPEYSGVPVEVALRNAEVAARRALDLDPYLAEAWTSSAGIAHERFEIERAESMYRRALELNPNYVLAYHWYCVLLRDVGRYDEALAQMARAAELDPLSLSVNANMGLVLEGLGRFRDAETSFRKVIRIDPSQPTGYLRLGEMNANALNRFADAVALTQKAIELDPDFPTPAASLAQMYLDLGEYSKSLETVAQAAKRWPDATLVQLASASIRVFQPNTSTALQDAQRVINSWPRLLPRALTILRDADLQDERYDTALDRYQKSYPELVQPVPRVERSNYRASIDLALVFQRRGDNQLANALLDGAARVVRIAPRLGGEGYGIADVQIEALRGQKATALAALREAEQAGWRGWWRYHRDLDPNLASIRNEPEFKAVFADIERDMAKQRAALAARPKDAPLDLAATGT